MSEGGFFPAGVAMLFGRNGGFGLNMTVGSWVKKGLKSVRVIK